MSRDPSPSALRASLRGPDVFLQPQGFRADSDRLARNLGCIGRGPEDVDEVDLVGHVEQRSIDALAKQRLRVRVDRDDAEPASLQAFWNGAAGFVWIARRADDSDGPGALEDLVRTAA